MATPLIGVCVGLLGTGSVVLGGLAALVSFGTGGLGGPGGAVLPSAAATRQIPAAMLTLYQQAASGCPGLPWVVLAAIGTVESGNGTSDLPGVHAGANAAGAEGPMQFEPATFAAYDQPEPPGGAAPPSPYDPIDATYAAARDLCANGAANGANLAGAVFDYNHSQAYVAQVMALAASYGQPAAVAGTPAGPAGGRAVTWALAQVGTPYVWGGEDPAAPGHPGGFDCSGLVQAAYREAGIALPRVAQDQFDAGPALPPGAPLAPGDLVFFGGSPTDVGHVGLVVSPGVMVDAPHTGADVREDTFPTVIGASWGSDLYLGATRPG
jgi:cell wall-associated NlpC family hydrolase